MIYNYPSPIGNIVVSIHSDRCIGIDLAPEVENGEMAPAGSPLVDWLTSYFSGTPMEIDSLPLELIGTDFQKKIWRLLLKIPFGYTISYGGLARLYCGSTKFARAVGHAAGANPLLIVVPCHRLVGENSLGGYRHGSKIKNYLLEFEKNIMSEFKQ